MFEPISIISPQTGLAIQAYLVHFYIGYRMLLAGPDVHSLNCLPRALYTSVMKST